MNDNMSLSFVQHELTPDANMNSDESLKSVISGPTRQQHVCYYPLLAYNSLIPDNSELILTNMAEYGSNKTSQVINLEAWRFVSFVESPCQGDTFESIQESHS